MIGPFETILHDVAHSAALRHLVCGAVAGGVAKTATAPLDRLKARRCCCFSVTLRLKCTLFFAAVCLLEVGTDSNAILSHTHAYPPIPRAYIRPSCPDFNPGGHGALHAARRRAARGGRCAQGGRRGFVAGAPPAGGLHPCTHPPYPLRHLSFF